MNRRARWPATVVAALLVAAPLERGPAAAARPPAPDTVSVTLQAPTPLLAGPGTPLRVRVRLVDTGAETLRGLDVRLRVVSTRLGTREQLDRWLGGRDPREGVAVGSPAKGPARLGRQAASAVDVEVPGSALGLTGHAFGAYGLVVEVRALVDGSHQRVGLLRTAVPWQSRKEYRAQDISWLVPFTGLPGASPAADLGPVQLAAAVGPGSRLRNLLDAASAPGVSWAVDPALLATLQEAASGAGVGAPGVPPATGPASTPGSTGTSSADVERARSEIRGFLQDLRAAAAGREVLELPYADPDVAALTRARASDLLVAARAAAPGVVSQLLGVPTRSDIGWPSNGYASNATLGTWRAGGFTTVVVDPRLRPLVDPPSYTVDARFALPQAVTGLAYDATLSGLLGSLSRTDAGASAAFLAQTAAATSELPGTVRRVLVAAPRDLDPDPVAFRSMVAATATVPWLQQVAVADLLPALPASSTAALPRRSLRPAAVPRGVGIRDVATVRRLREQLQAIAEVLDSPATATLPGQRSTLELLSVAWRGHHDALIARQQAIADSIGSRTDGVRVLPSTINLLSTDGRVQVTVANGLRQRVRGVRLEVSAASPKLQVMRPRSAPLTLEAGQRTGVRVPVRALASGLVTLQARLVTPSGSQIGVPQEVQVRLRPTDSWLLSAVGGAVALVVLFGLVRSFLRGRRRVDVPAVLPQESR